MGALEAGKSVDLGTNDILRVNLQGQPSTGHTWHLESIDSSVLRQVDKAIDAAPAFGGVDTQVFKFVAVAPGQTTLRFVKRRLWEPVNPASPIYAITVVADGAFSGTYATARTVQALTAGATATAAFPAHYNTCDNGKCTPIKDQGGCGSCWAFATVGAFENRIYQVDGVVRDLSEQYLVSCNIGGTCAGGGAAFNAFTTAIPAGETAAGAVYEADFPYVAADTPCNGPHPHHEKAMTAGWLGVTPDQAVAQLKALIFYEGPTAASVCADGDFGAYTGGIYRATSTCANHLVVITGWDDNNGDGYFYLRNSWGPAFGESGYMRIAYGAGGLVAAGTYTYGTSTANARYHVPGTIQAVDVDAQIGLAVENNNTDLGTLDEAEWFCFLGIDTTTLATLNMQIATPNSGGKFRVMLDGLADENEIGQWTVQSTGGFDKWATISYPISYTKPGIHGLCFHGLSGTGIFNVKSIGLASTTCTPQCSGKVCGDDTCGGTCGTCATGTTCNTSGQCVAAPARFHAGDTVQAEAYTTQTGTALENGNTTVGYFDAGDSLCYDGVDLTGVTSLNVTLAAATTGGVFTLRTDSATGTEIARTTVQATGGWGTWKPVSVPVTATSGVHTLCIKGETGSGITNFDAFTLVGQCVPSCSGKACGPNGCGGTCGTCSTGQTCNASGQCETPPAGNRVVIKTNRDSKFVVLDGTGYLVWTGATQANAEILEKVAATGTQFKLRATSTGKFVTLDANDRLVATADQAGGMVFDAPACDAPKVGLNAVNDNDTAKWVAADAGNYLIARSGSCGVGNAVAWEKFELIAATPCTPVCTGKQCGSDGCGGSCGTCPSGTSCNASSQCVCTPVCTGKQCGSDGCGGSCGTCPSGTTCNASGQCQAGGTCTDVALPRTAAVASSTENGGTPASAAIDGNTGTRWSSAFSDPQWIYVDLGAARYIKHVVLRWETASSADYDIQVSPDAANWTTKYTGKATGASTDTITSGLGVVARYVRMYSRKRNTGYGNSLWELEVYGDTNSTCTP